MGLLGALTPPATRRSGPILVSIVTPTHHVDTRRATTASTRLTPKWRGATGWTSRCETLPGPAQTTSRSRDGQAPGHAAAPHPGEAATAPRRGGRTYGRRGAHDRPRGPGGETTPKPRPPPRRPAAAQAAKTDAGRRVWRPPRSGRSDEAPEGRYSCAHSRTENATSYFPLVSLLFQSL